MKKILLFLFLIACFASAYAASIDTLVVRSKAMNKDIVNVVILPDDYATQTKDYPVIYLLHGAGGYYGSWLFIAPQLLDEADTRGFIIVCPDGGSTSWYLDSPVDEQMKYETYMAVELIEEIDKTYPTRPDRSARAISGLSMGGHGAFYLCFRHPDIWGAAGSTSGGLDIRPFPRNWDLPKRLGAYAQYPEHWEQHTVSNMVGLIEGKSLSLIFDCGVDDFFYEVNKTFHRKLLDNNIPHTYIERPGGHTIDYWSNAINYHLLFFDHFFRSF